MIAYGHYYYGSVGRSVDPMNFLTFSSIYPNTAQLIRGICMENTLRHLVASSEVDARVVAPVPLFPVTFGPFRSAKRIGLVGPNFAVGREFGRTQGSGPHDYGAAEFAGYQTTPCRHGRKTPEPGKFGAQIGGARSGDFSGPHSP